MAFNATLVGSPAFVVADAGWGNAISLNGSTQYGTLQTTGGPLDWLNTDSWTIHARVLTSQSTGNPVILGAKDAGNTTNIWYLALLSGQPQFVLNGTGGFSAQASASVADGTWHLITVVVEQCKRIRIYIDGSQSGATQAGGPWVIPAAVGNAYVGGWNGAGSFNGQISELCMVKAAMYQANFTAPSSPFSASQLGQQLLFHFDESTGATTAVDSNTANQLTVLPQDPSIVYSPYNWLTTAPFAITTNYGAYLRMQFTGTTCALRFDNLRTNTPYSYVKARIDGGAWTTFRVDGAILNLTPTPLFSQRHILELVVRSTNGNGTDRWGQTTTSPPPVSVTLTGILVDNGATLQTPVRRKLNILVYGDSITEGADSVANSDTIVQDAALGTGYLLSHALPAEVGTVAFSGQGIYSSLSPYPPLTTSYASLWYNVPRSFSPPPDAVLYLLGQNDQSTAANITGALTTVLQAMLVNAPQAKHFVITPVSQANANAIAAAATGINDSRVKLVTTSGWVTLSGPNIIALDSSDGVHPYAEQYLGQIVDRIAAAVFNSLISSGTGGSGVVLVGHGSIS